MELFCADCFFFVLTTLLFPRSETVPVLDSATQLLEENNQLLSQIAANIRTLKVRILIYFI